MGNGPAGQVEWFCPRHALPLRPTATALECPNGEAFPVCGEIPRFVESSAYAEAFGEQWKRFARTELDSASGIPLSRDRLRRILGEELWAELPGLNVLEAGCGAGRFTEVLLNEGANVVSFDLSEAVEVNARNFPVSNRHRVAQADVYAIPVAPESFDLVLGIGMVQHTPDPARTIAELYERVKPGGWLGVDHYRLSLSWVGLVSVYRRRFRRLSPSESIARVERTVDRWLPVHRGAARYPLLRRSLQLVSPLQAYYGVIPELDDSQQREWAVLSTHDGLTDAYKHLRTRRWLKRTLVGLGTERVECWRGGNGIEARARKPD